MKYTCLVKPGSKKGPLVVEGEAGLVVYLREKPHDGEANAGLVRVLAEHFNVPKTSIRIASGAAGRRKIVEIE